MIRHVFKWKKGGLGAFTGIILKGRYQRYSDFHNQKAKWKQGKRGMNKTDHHNAAASMLTKHQSK